MEILRQLKEFYATEKKLILGAFLFLVIATGIGLVQPFLVSYLIDSIIIPANYELVAPIALSVVGVVCLKALSQFLHGFCGGRLGNRVATKMRNRLYEKLNTLSFQYYDKAKTGDLMSRLTADLEAIRNFMGFGFAQLLNLFFMFVLGGAMMIAINWKLTLITLLPVPVLLFLAVRFELQIHPIFREMRKAMSHLTTAVQENITGVRTVKSYAQEVYEVNKFAGRSENFRSNQIEASTKWSIYFPIIEAIANLCVMLLFVVGGIMVINGNISPGNFIAFFSLIWYIIGPMWNLGFHINNYTQFKASSERVLTLMNEPIHIKNNVDSIELSSHTTRGDVAFNDVTFNYPDNKPALENITINAPAGTVIGLLGPTGAGKSTIIQLLMRAYDVKKGSITIDGINIKDLDVAALRTLIAPVFQETFLFSATIRDNIAYGITNVSEEQIIEAAKLAQAHDFIMEMPEGYDTVVGERGMGLSGGQKQRIAIARAFIKNPKILVLDDATSAVDMETEHEIQAGFKQLMAGRTTFIIAHRISSLRFADEIIVLNEGRIVQRGKHEQLLKQAGPYRETYEIQYADFPSELEAAAINVD